MHLILILLNRLDSKDFTLRTLVILGCYSITWSSGWSKFLLITPKFPFLADISEIKNLFKGTISQGRNNVFWHHKWPNQVDLGGILGRYSIIWSSGWSKMLLMSPKVGFLADISEIKNLYKGTISQGRDNVFWQHKWPNQIGQRGIS